MTIHFAPGDANLSLEAHHQAQWREHHIIAYGSGNNLIIYTITNGNKSLETIYLPEDLKAVHINSKNGLLAIACGAEIIIYRPLNEYMVIPKWTEATRFTPDSSYVNCVKWVPLEMELAAGTERSLLLYHVKYEYGTIEYQLRWEKIQAAAVEGLGITEDGSKIVSYNYGNFDSFAKVWTRLTYGDTTSLFDLVYADHDSLQYLLFFQWRTKANILNVESYKNALASMVHIKNIRNFMPSLSSEENDILYTVTNDFMLHIWATCDFNGHGYLKKWSSLKFADLVTDFVSFLILDGENSIVDEFLEAESAQGKLSVQDLLRKTSDYIMVIGANETKLLRISNVSAKPPNNITFDEICSFCTNSTCFPTYKLSEVKVEEVKCFEVPSKTLHQKQVDTFQSRNFPVVCKDTLMLSSDPARMYFLVHDRVKETLRSESLRLKRSPGFQLHEKFQGHGKSVKKMYTSSSSHQGNIMLSSSQFPDHNYIWEPLTLKNTKDSAVAITKRFRLNVTRDALTNLHEQGIESAVLLNDVYPAENSLRHHLAVIYEKGGYLSIWDCDGETMDDQEAALVMRMETLGVQESRNGIPQAFFSKHISKRSYVIVSIYNPSKIEAWVITLGSKINAKANICCKKVSVDNLPNHYTGHVKISAVERFLEKDITLIDEAGLLRSVSIEYIPESQTVSWTEILSIRTNIERASLVHGTSLVGKTAIVNELGNTVSIWDTKAGVLEYEEVFSCEHGPVRDLDWTFLGSIGTTAYTILAVGFSRFVLLYTQLRYDYTNKVATFAALKKIDISDYSSHGIGDSIWLDDSYLVISSGNQFFIDDKWIPFSVNSKAMSNSSIISTIRQLLVGYRTDRSRFPIADLVSILNGPLPIYHPQFLIQALLMDETTLVEAILVKLLKCLRNDDNIAWNLDLETIDLLTLKNSKNIARNTLFDSAPLLSDDDIFGSFNPNVADLLSDKLTLVSLPLLTRHQQTTLRNLVVLLNKLLPFKNSLDSNGMKYLYGFELFRSSHKQVKLTMRDINWAVHSDQKEMLFATIENHYRRLTWSSVRQVGLAFWVDEHRLKSTMEKAARNEFADERDPSGITSVLYLAIKKKQVLLGLWRTVSHPEKNKVLKFLSNNFTEPRWKSAALKNAFVLLGKHRYMDAAYFFLLADKVKDCCMTLCSKLQEFDLALAVARVNTDQDAITTILESYILPGALVSGDRWTTSWAFWELKLHEISIQALVMSPIDVVTNNIEHFSKTFKKNTASLAIETKSKSFLRVDPALGVLYQKLRSSKLRYLEGSKAVSPQIEFDFVVRLSTIYSRMGCDYLSLLLLLNWGFLDYSKRENALEPTAMKDAFVEFTGPVKQRKSAPEPSIFEEPDMSAFSFGF